MTATREELVKQKEALGLTVAQIAERSGVPAGTLGKIFSGITISPRRATLDAIERALNYSLRLKEGKAAGYEQRSSAFTGVCESGALPAFGSSRFYGPDGKWPFQGSYTAEDYFAYPGEERTELIEGSFFEMEGPNAVHQAVLTELMVAFHSLIKAGKGKCRVFPSPFDVELFPGGNTVLQPDLVIICDRSRLTGHVVGAPDLVVEIISPSTRRKDHGKKLALYMAAGVREYWIVDPYRQTVVVYDFRVDALVHIYGFEDRIPVAIWDNACCVDFAEIKEAVADLMEE